MFFTRSLWLLMGFVLATTIFYLSVLTPYIPTVDVNHIDKLYHLIAYSALMWWWAQLFLVRRLPSVFLVVVGFGVLIEFVQPLTGRFFEVADIAANTAGALLGLFIAQRGPQSLRQRFC